MAYDKDKARHFEPEILSTDKVILHIGCGMGQTFIEMKCTDKKCIGIDVDVDAIQDGKNQHGEEIDFYVANADDIPCASKTVDIVFSRVALPYTNIPLAIKEIRRVLSDDGRVWLSFHSKKLVKRWIKNSFKAGNFKDVIHKSYALVNGYFIKYLSISVPFLDGKHESWQDADTIIRFLAENGIESTGYEVGEHLVVEGRLVKN